MNYQVSIIGKTTIIADPASGFRMMAAVQQDMAPITGKAFAIATMYKENQGFRPVNSYHFAAVDTNGQWLASADIVALKTAIDFFFLTILNTELYVKEIPQNSSLYAEEAARIYGITLIAA